MATKLYELEAIDKKTGKTFRQLELTAQQAWSMMGDILRYKVLSIKEMPYTAEQKLQAIRD